MNDNGKDGELLLLNTSWRVLLLALAVAGCEAEVYVESDWMLGTFSMIHSTGFVRSVIQVDQFEFREDGTLTITRLDGCSANLVREVHELKWQRDGESRVTFQMPDTAPPFVQTMVLTPGRSCRSLSLAELDAPPQLKADLQRGRYCMYELPPCEMGMECPYCDAGLCDGPLAPCED